MVQADKRSYEYAMLRTLGLRTKELIILVISKGLQITIPALLLGLAFALLGLLMVDIVLEAVAGVSSRLRGGRSPLGLCTFQMITLARCEG